MGETEKVTTEDIPSPEEPLRATFCFLQPQLINETMNMMRGMTIAILLAVCTYPIVDSKAEGNVQLPDEGSVPRYVCCLLINEVPFPGERGYRSEHDSKTAMNAMLHVLDRRLHKIPPRYTQREVADVSTERIVDVITAGGIKGQFDGFYMERAGKPGMSWRVKKRLKHLVKIGNQGEPGTFARLLNYAASLANAYVKTGESNSPDPHAAIRRVRGVVVTGGGYAWMTDMAHFHPGGNFLRIPNEHYGRLGGNRFFTLREYPVKDK